MSPIQNSDRLSNPHIKNSDRPSLKQFKTAIAFLYPNYKQRSPFSIPI
ncbi:MAG: hypothetical protein KA717_38965 [Woronichinia naegeliana WA131]|uniref:Uncharacterized protein n=1 Tax=Woronichinia naegeliana WA131 TaxID=2824559 RepID=A0A977PWA0_9CYAN|nr:MAG: hypothetical protein KA717_38965 [Woronichinia naegeliana WA131]